MLEPSRRKSLSLNRGSRAEAIANWLPLIVVGLCVALLYRRDASWPAWEVYPHVVHLLDPSILDQDSYVRAEDGYGARFYWVRFIAPLVSAVGFWTAMSLLNLWVVLGLLLAIVLVARASLSTEGAVSRASALLALVVVVTGPNWTLAAYDLFVPNPAASAFVQPIFVLSLLASASGRPLIGATLAGLASVVHPSLGLLIGGVALLIASIDVLQAGETTAGVFRALVVPAAVLTILLGINLVPWLMATRDPLPSGEFIDIVAVYRHPWHYVPSYFLLERDEWRSIVAWLVALPSLAAVAWSALSRTGRLLLLIGPASIFLWIVGYVFVEVVPSRLVAGFIPFRFSQYLMLVLAFLVPAAVLSLFRRSAALAPLALAIVVTSVLGEQWIPWWSLPTVSVASAVAYFLARGRELPTFVIPVRLGKLRTRFATVASTPADLGLFVVAASLVGWALGRAWLKSAPLEVILLSALATTTVRGAIGRVGRMALLAPFVLIVPILILGSPADPRAIDSPEVVAASLMVRDRTPSGAVILTPPHFDAVRVLSHRAILTGDSFPFLDGPMRKWFETQRLVYGSCEHLLPCEERYSRLSATELARLAREFDLRYAIVTDEPRGYEVLAQSGRYLLVRLSPEVLGAGP